MQSHWAFQRMCEWAVPELLPIEIVDEKECKYARMSRGHLALAHAMFERRCLGSFLFPDTVFADGVLREAIRRQKSSGAAAILAFCPRLATWSAIEELLETGRFAPGGAAIFTPRELVAVGLRHMDPETQAYEFTSTCFGYKPTMVSWRVPDRTGLLFHSLHWQPILMDFDALPTHDIRCLEEWTLDGDYVYRNVPDPAHVVMIDESEDAMLLSFSHDVRDAEAPPQRLQRLPGIAGIFKRLLLRHRLQTARFDPLKFALFARPVRLRHTDASPAWETTERAAAAIVADALRPLSPWESRLLRILLILNGSIGFHARLWFRRRFSAVR